MGEWVEARQSFGLAMDWPLLGIHCIIVACRGRYGRRGGREPIAHADGRISGARPAHRALLGSPSISVARRSRTPLTASPQTDAIAADPGDARAPAGGRRAGLSAGPARALRRAYLGRTAGSPRAPWLCGHLRREAITSPTGRVAPNRRDCGRSGRRACTCRTG